MAATPDFEDNAASVTKEVFRSIFAYDLIRLQREFPTFDYVNSRDPSKPDITAVHRAAECGNYEMTKWILSKGVGKAMKTDRHLQTVLHSGVKGRNARIIRLLLDAGANRNMMDKSGFTASQYASILGYKYVLAALDNYVSEEQVAKFTMPNEDGIQINLPTEVIKPLTHLIMLINVHPFRVALDMPKTFYDGTYTKIIIRALKTMRDRKMRGSPRSYDIALSYKFHYLFHILNDIKNQVPMVRGSTQPEWFIMKLRFMDFLIFSFIESSLNTFPYYGSPKFQRIIARVNCTEKTSQFYDVAMRILAYARGVEDMDFPGGKPVCALCTQIDVSMKCVYCKNENYCDMKCQLVHWPYHEFACNVPGANWPPVMEVTSGAQQLSAGYYYQWKFSNPATEIGVEMSETDEETLTEEEMTSDEEASTSEKMLTEESATREESATGEEVATDKANKLIEEPILLLGIIVAIISSIIWHYFFPKRF